MQASLVCIAAGYWYNRRGDSARALHYFNQHCELSTTDPRMQGASPQHVQSLLNCAACAYANGDKQTAAKWGKQAKALFVQTWFASDTLFQTVFRDRLNQLPGLQRLIMATL